MDPITAWDDIGILIVDETDPDVDTFGALKWDGEPAQVDWEQLPKHFTLLLKHAEGPDEA